LSAARSLISGGTSGSAARSSARRSVAHRTARRQSSVKPGGKPAGVKIRTLRGVDRRDGSGGARIARAGRRTAECVALRAPQPPLPPLQGRRVDPVAATELREILAALRQLRHQGLPLPPLRRRVLARFSAMSHLLAHQPDEPGGQAVGAVNGTLTHIWRQDACGQGRRPSTRTARSALCFFDC